MLRSLLFLPGNSPNMLVNGDILGADGIILDLEDAVSHDEKDAARILVRNALKHLNYSNVIIRINSLDENLFWQHDIDEVIPLKPNMILLPKTNTAGDVKQLSAYMETVEKEHGIETGTVKIMPLLETAAGIENAYSIGISDSRVAAVLLGAEDLTADLHCERTKEGKEIFYARSRVVMAARAAGIDPIDTPFTDVNDDEGIYKDARFAKSLGFSGKAAISPRHVNAINMTFSPTKKEIEYALDVLAAIDEAKAQGKGAVSLYGKMVDKPIVLRAEQVISMAMNLNMTIEQYEPGKKCGDCRNGKEAGCNE